MATKPSIAIVGPGRLGTVLAISLHEAGYKIQVILARSGKPLTKARSLAKSVGARAVSDRRDVDAGVVWLCVPDSEIANAAKALATTTHWKGRVVFHSSGALLSDELRALRRRGASGASVHPLMTFVQSSSPSVAGVPFAVEGDAVAVRMARRIVRDLGGRAYSIAKKDKAAYHAWGTFASPLLAALLATTEQVAGRAGVRGKEARLRMFPILLRTLANYAAFGGPAAFSGPIVRGDVDTIARHLQVLRSVPVAREVYLALARAALQYLPVKNRIALKRLLVSSAR